jgi:hypothetical protein
MRYFPNRGGSARQDFDAAIRADPTNLYAWYNRAGTYSGLDIHVFAGARDYDPRPGWAAGISDLTEAVRLKPDFAQA